MASPGRRDVLAPAAPRRWPFTIANARFLFAANAALIAVIWLRHFDFEAATTPAAILTGAGELTALLGTYLVRRQTR